jgi:hypothetical protein
MNRGHVVRRLVYVCALVIALSESADAATLRGRLYRVYPNGFQSVAGGIAVTLYSPNMGRTSPATSGPDGMYYLYNIPPGTYNLEIWVSNPPLVFQVQVQEPYTDIPPIRVP